jgi:hypothetical protein
MSVVEFAERFHNEMVPLTNTISYFSAAPLGEEEIKDYLDDPLAALPPLVRQALPKISILLVPYLEKPNGSGSGTGMVAFDPPPERLADLAAHWSTPNGVFLAFSTKGQDVGEYHYRFYRTVAEVFADKWSAKVQSRYFTLLREEFGAKAHGEVDEQSWRLKQTLLRRQTNVRRETKLFRDYASQSFVDTLTLYLHGICCDIDIETGPRQLPSCYLRRRLMALIELFPPPEGYAVFPEGLTEA